MSLKKTFWKIFSNPPGANELRHGVAVYCGIIGMKWRPRITLAEWVFWLGHWILKYKTPPCLNGYLLIRIRQGFFNGTVAFKCLPQFNSNDSQNLVKLNLYLTLNKTHQNMGNVVYSSQYAPGVSLVWTVLSQFYPHVYTSRLVHWLAQSWSYCCKSL